MGLGKPTVGNILAFIYLHLPPAVVLVIFTTSVWARGDISNSTPGEAIGSAGNGDAGNGDSRASADSGFAPFVVS